MVIEWLDFQVKPELREKFIEEDRAIWGAMLSNIPGFLGKEIWIDPRVSDRLSIVIRWQTREQWKAVSYDLLQETEKKFALVMGADSYQMIQVKEYQVRKFPVGI